MPEIEKVSAFKGGWAILAMHLKPGEFVLSCEGEPRLLFTESETNRQRILGEQNPSPYVKDAFHDFLVNGNVGAINSQQ